MLASHAVKRVSEQEPEDVGAYCFLADLGGWLTFAAAMTTTLILSETAVDYLHFMFGRRPELWVTGLIVTSGRASHHCEFRAGVRPNQDTAQVVG